MESNSFYCGKHIVSAKDFDKRTLDIIFKRTALIKKFYETVTGRNMLRTVLLRNGIPVRVKLLFGSPSLRTTDSFSDAVWSLGGYAKDHLLPFSSRVKGEADYSIARVVSSYGRADCIVIRDDSKVGIAKEFADTIDHYGFSVSVINGGDGNFEHPTQMLTDLYTVYEKKTHAYVSGAITYALVGDIADSRTIHSFLIGLKHHGGRVFLVAPHNVNLPPWLTQEIKTVTLDIKKISDPFEIARTVDVWYFTRLQSNLKAAAVSDAEKQEYARKYGATEPLRELMNKDAIVLHPLPHGPEFQDRIDWVDKRFVHFEQADNGFFVRMALLTMLFAPDFPDIAHFVK